MMCSCLRFRYSDLSIWLVSCTGFFFFKQKTAYEMRISDWSSDVCSSDLPASVNGRRRRRHVYAGQGLLPRRPEECLPGGVRRSRIEVPRGRELVAVGVEPTGLDECGRPAPQRVEVHEEGGLAAVAHARPIGRAHV